MSATYGYHICPNIACTIFNTSPHIGNETEFAACLEVTTEYAPVR